MSENEPRCATVLRSIHFVIKAENLLKKAGFWLEIIPIPKEISSECGMALEFLADDLEAILNILKQHHLEIMGIYRLQGSLFTKL